MPIPGRDYLAIAIWEDSFDVFLTLKKALISKDFQYRLILVREGDSITTGGHGGEVMN